MNAIVAFANNYPKGGESIDRSVVLKVIREYAMSFDDPKLTSAWAMGLADVMEKTLSDTAVVELAGTSSPIALINAAFEAYTDRCKKQVDSLHTHLLTQQEAQIVSSAKGMQDLSIAAASFGAFMALVFLTLMMRIERHLRSLPCTLSRTQ